MFLFSKTTKNVAERVRVGRSPLLWCAAARKDALFLCVEHCVGDRTACPLLSPPSVCLFFFVSYTRHVSLSHSYICHTTSYRLSLVIKKKTGGARLAHALMPTYPHICPSSLPPSHAVPLQLQLQLRPQASSISFIPCLQ